MFTELILLYLKTPLKTETKVNAKMEGVKHKIIAAIN